MSALWFTIPVGLGALLLAWRALRSDPWGSDAWRNEQTWRKYSERFDQRYPR